LDINQKLLTFRKEIEENFVKIFADTVFVRLTDEFISLCVLINRILYIEGSRKFDIGTLFSGGSSRDFLQ
jgi:hypothetical protein